MEETREVTLATKENVMTDQSQQVDKATQYVEAVFAAYHVFTPHPWDRTPTPDDVHCPSCDTFIGLSGDLDEDDQCPNCNECI